MKFNPSSQLDGWCSRLSNTIASSHRKDENSENIIISLFLSTCLFLQIWTHQFLMMFGTEYSSVCTWVTNSPAVLTVYSPSTADQISSIIHYSNCSKEIRVRKSFLSYSSVGFPDTSSDTQSKDFCSAFIHTFLFLPGRWAIGWKGVSGGSRAKTVEEGKYLSC